MFPNPRMAVMVLLLAGAAWPQKVDPPRGASTAEERLLFPRDFARGYIDFEVAPPHNEIDLGMCKPIGEHANPGGSSCSAFARYIWSGYLEVQPLGRTPLRRVFVFLEPSFFGGENDPQLRYTASASPILLERTIGLGIDLGRQFQFRASQHQSSVFGRYSKPGVTTLRNDGPYGVHATFGVRWYFGGYGGR